MSEKQNKKEIESLAGIESVNNLGNIDNIENIEVLGDSTKKLKGNLQELENTRKALINMLEDFEEARRRAEEERMKTESVIEKFADGIIILEDDEAISFLNPQAEIFFNISNEAVAGKRIEELLKIDIFAKLYEVLKKGVEGLFRKEMIVNENFILEVSTISISRGEEKRGTLVILHDVTREKMTERMKTEFVSVAAHQLRTPLAAIKWTLRMLLDGDIGDLSDEPREFLQKTYVSNERMINLVNDLLNVTRIEEGRYLYRPALTNFTKEVIYVIDSYKDIIKKKNIKLLFEKSEETIPDIFLDVEKIRVSIQNLLDNAVKYTPLGGEVSISIKKEKDNVVFKISDSGIGIPKDQQGRIFSKFFRGENAVRKETEGSGLGLFIAKNIIEAHKGRIWFESEDGKGSTFYFSLPLLENTGKENDKVVE